MSADHSNTRIANIVIPILSMVVALSGVSVGIFTSNKALNVISDRTRDEFTFEARQRGYGLVIGGILRACQAAESGRLGDIQSSLNEIESGYIVLRPFLGIKARTALKKSIDSIYSEIKRILLREPNNKLWESPHGKCEDIRNSVTDSLADAVFGNREKQNVEK